MTAAAYFALRLEPVSGYGLPTTEGLLTASDCLTDRLPSDDDEHCWFGSPAEVLAACGGALPPEGRLCSLCLPADSAAVLAEEIRAAHPHAHEPVLLPDHPHPPAPAGRVLGWEVLGYDVGLLHTWLCNDLYRDAVRDLAVTTTPYGLLPDHPTAARLAAWANARTDTKPVTWFAAALAVHD
ncbi:hypothetical protein KSE_17990 [Kitasatospora setae KM-6054]|uniref:Uncharacterized protein n=1 Tax=Kitasatospora setae (strain ATCC 33774 / DSM 43861 / JCM 3304 / KCC A-0304 / NBRC 14216 / KM-6054) TaxID=452652 RepID=E4N8U3_KITSK|nr:hypothetical protein KSE_17990 [Kitasatospora setae KM-6054]